MIKLDKIEKQIANIASDSKLPPDEKTREIVKLINTFQSSFHTRLEGRFVSQVRLFATEQLLNSTTRRK